jgi:transcriptional regulator with XRE-family HTH domain
MQQQSDIAVQFKEILTELEEVYGLKQVEIAKAVGVNRSTINRINKGEQSGSPDLLEQLIEFRDSNATKSFVQWRSLREKARAESLSTACGLSTADFILECVTRFGEQTARAIVDENKRVIALREEANSASTATALDILPSKAATVAGSAALPKSSATGAPIGKASAPSPTDQKGRDDRR